MKVAFVLGFFNPVESVLRGEFANELDAGNLIWLGQTSWNRPPDLENFKTRLFQVISDGTNDGILVLFASVRAYEWAEHRVKSIIDAASNRSPGRIDFVILHNAQDSVEVVKQITDFGLFVNKEVISEEMIQKFLGGSKALCVRASWQSSFEKSLLRAGITQEWCEKYFVEEAVIPAPNSNLVQRLKEKATSFDYLLYAWKSLRTLPSDVKQKYNGKVIEGESPAVVVELLKKRILSK